MVLWQADKAENVALAAGHYGDEAIKQERVSEKEG